MFNDAHNRWVRTAKNLQASKQAGRQRVQTLKGLAQLKATDKREEGALKRKRLGERGASQRTMAQQQAQDRRKVFGEQSQNYRTQLNNRASMAAARARGGETGGLSGDNLMDNFLDYSQRYDELYGQRLEEIGREDYEIEKRNSFLKNLKGLGLLQGADKDTGGDATDGENNLLAHMGINTQSAPTSTSPTQQAGQPTALRPPQMMMGGGYPRKWGQAPEVRHYDWGTTREYNAPGEGQLIEIDRNNRQPQATRPAPQPAPQEQQAQQAAQRRTPFRPPGEVGPGGFAQDDAAARDALAAEEEGGSTAEPEKKTTAKPEPQEKTANVLSGGLEGNRARAEALKNLPRNVANAVRGVNDFFSLQDKYKDLAQAIPGVARRFAEAGPDVPERYRGRLKSQSELPNFTRRGLQAVQDEFSGVTQIPERASDIYQQVASKVQKYFGGPKKARAAEVQGIVERVNRRAQEMGLDLLNMNDEQMNLLLSEVLNEQTPRGQGTPGANRPNSLREFDLQ